MILDLECPVCGADHSVLVKPRRGFDCEEYERLLDDEQHLCPRCRAEISGEDEIEDRDSEEECDE